LNDWPVTFTCDTCTAAVPLFVIETVALDAWPTATAPKSMELSVTDNAPFCILAPHPAITNKAHEPASTPKFATRLDLRDHRRTFSPNLLSFKMLSLKVAPDLSEKRTGISYIYFTSVSVCDYPFRALTLPGKGRLSSRRSGTQKYFKADLRAYVWPSPLTVETRI
jgi:hypothetical protein